MNTMWPENAPFALGLSHDVDRVSKRGQFFYYITKSIFCLQLKELIRQIYSFQALIRGEDPYWNFSRIMSLEQELGVRSTFFFMNEKGKAVWSNPQSMILYLGRYSIKDGRIQKIIRDLHHNGWEIGLHGSFKSYHDRMLMAREKADLEAVLGKPIKGIRQHYLNLTIPDTWNIQADLGFDYDSSLGFSDRIGFRWRKYHPFYPKDPLTDQEIPILQIPMAIMDSVIMGMDQPWNKALGLIDAIEHNHGVLTLNWHQRVFNPWEYKEHQNLYARIVTECQKRGAWIGTLGAIADWWIKMNRF